MVNLYFNCFVEKYSPEKSVNKVLINFSDDYFDFKKNIHILKICIKSFSLLKVKNALFNIKLDTCFAESDKKDIEDHIKNLFPKTTLEINFDRPSTIEEWIDESKKIEIFFDEDPVLYTYNLDHLFSSNNPSLFHYYINEFKRLTYGKINTALAVTHAPEINSIIFNLKNYMQRFKFQGVNINISEDTKIENFSRTKFKNFIDSTFVAYKEFSRFLWSKAKLTSNDLYVPRPDHYTVVFEDLEFFMWFTNDELLRHFDGYNHTTNLSQYDFSFSYIREEDNQLIVSSSRSTDNYKYQPMIVNNFKKINITPSTSLDETRYLLEIFFIAIRDQIFVSLFVNRETIDIKNIIRKILSSYKGKNIDLSNINPSLRTRIYSEIVYNVQKNMPFFISDCLTFIKYHESGFGPIPLNLLDNNLSFILRLKNFFLKKIKIFLK